MTNVYIDCEFNGFAGQLISMAMVTDDGREWYEVLPLPRVVDPWVAMHVIPILGKESISQEEFRASFWRFLMQVERPEIIADWYADLVHFLSMFAGRRHDESVNYPCSLTLRGVPRYVPEIPHNALSDARAIRAALRAA